MKVKFTITGTVDVSKGDYNALEAASPLALVETANMQGAKMSKSVKAVKQDKSADEAQQQS